MKLPSWIRRWKNSDLTAGQPMPATNDPEWERALINRMAAEFLCQQRRSRRWGLVLKFGILAYLLLLSMTLVMDGIGGSVGSAGEHTAVVKVEGLIADKTNASADRIVEGLRDAFEAENAQAIILSINSPGGSPVQSGYVFDEIKRLREQYPDKPVYAVAADVCASGAYYIASAADEIYVDRATLIGSIGVRLDSFGFQRVIDELGIQRRLLTAGEHKGILDPFSNFDEWDREFIQGLLDNLHAQFITAVKEGRGDRLKGGPELFSGLFWTGQESVELGLSDGLGSPSYVAREIVGAEELVDYSQERDLWERVAERVGTSLATTLVERIGIGAPSLR
ncbi:S49 family peptidase [Lamprobacter modestohalophilus]|uniref:S49 family peptidase n=1 Tax=Lamprobacter modestohalophilus TaxID=1064514 RepID=UPI002ADEE0FB|nr:S49 family peptidase [Lamprobacter modestohalophilus]MEA1051030.1 S49 family peptidase [Lamprobacter modestohalophilus]